MRLGNVKAHFVHTLSTPPCAHSLCAHPRVHTSRCAHPRVHTPVCTLCAHFAHTLCTLCAHPCVHALPVCTPLCAHPGRVVHHPVCTPRVCCCCCCYQVLPATTHQLLLLLLLLHFRSLASSGGLSVLRLASLSDALTPPPQQSRVNHCGKSFWSLAFALASKAL